MKMKPFVILAIVFFALFFSVSIYSQESKVPTSLRGGVTAKDSVIEKALALQKAGWVYQMPLPKSKQARWGNSDGRTTWWVGYWLNKKTKKTSLAVPTLKKGVWIGDGKGGRSWRRGGSPSKPTKLEWISSKSGGVTPR